MKESQLIRIMKEPLTDVLDQVGIEQVEGAFHSKVIAYAIWKFRIGKITEKDITDKNNVTGLTESDNVLKSYSNIKECILDFIDNHISRDGKTNSVLETDFVTNEYSNIAKKYNLYNIDKEYLSDNNKSIINLDEEKSKPDVDLYTVKDGDGREIMKTSNLEEAKEIKKDGSNRTIENSRNKIINGTQADYKSKSAVNVVLKLGSKIHCDNLNMYYKITDTAPGRAITGDYYLFDGRVFNGRYAICMKPELAGKDKNCVIGFVNVSDLKK